MQTAALDGALLVFHPGSGVTVALRDELWAVFELLRQQPASRDQLADRLAADVERIDDCLRLLKQQQLVYAPAP